MVRTKDTNIGANEGGNPMIEKSYFTPSEPIFNPFIVKANTSSKVSSLWQMRVKNRIAYNYSSTFTSIPQKYIVEEKRKSINLQKLKDLEKLEYNWNGNGAEPFTTEVLNNANYIYHNIIREPKIFPTGRKSIQFEYEKNNGDYLEFEIFHDRVEVYMEVSEEEKEITIPLINVVKKVNEVINEFFES